MWWSRPRPAPFHCSKSLIASARTVVRRYSTYANIANLAPTFIRRILERYEGTRLGRQELHAEILEDNPDALWSHALLDTTRVTQPPRVFDAVAIGIDPPGGLVTECGIVASGRSQDGQGYVLADRSTAGRPEQWATAAWAMALWLAETYDVRPWLIAEKNHGGEMVRSTLEVARPKGCSFRVELVTASQGKVARAEPVVMLYEQSRYHHVGTYPALEDEMTQWTPLDAEPAESQPARRASVERAWAETRRHDTRTRRHLGALMHTPPLVFVTWKWAGADAARQFPSRGRERALRHD